MSRASGKAPEQLGADRRKKESAVVERAEKRAARAEQKQQLGDEFKLRVCKLLVTYKLPFVEVV
jgi:hypothetical protein